MAGYGKKTALFIASEQGNVAIVLAMLRAGANVNISCLKEKWLALHVAYSSSNQSTESIEELLKTRANVNMNVGALSLIHQA